MQWLRQKTVIHIEADMDAFDAVPGASVKKMDVKA